MYFRYSRWAFISQGKWLIDFAFLDCWSWRNMTHMGNVNIIFGVVSDSVDDTFFSLPCLSRHFNTKTATFEAGGSAMNDCMKRKWQESVVWRDVLYTQCERRDVIVVFCDVQLKWTFMWMMCVSGHKESSASAALNNKSNQTKANLDNDVFSSSLLQWRSEQRSFILPKCW